MKWMKRMITCWVVGTVILDCISSMGPVSHLWQWGGADAHGEKGKKKKAKKSQLGNYRFIYSRKKVYGHLNYMKRMDGKVKILRSNITLTEALKN